MYDLFGDITDTANTQVTWLLNFTERILDWNKLKYQQYMTSLRCFKSSSRVREVTKQHHSEQQRKIQEIKTLGDLWQHSPKHQGILSDSSGGEK